MTDDTEFIQTHIDFHPCSTPHGTLHYDLKYLTPNQQNFLNEYKYIEIRENEKYLAQHPEIRALIVLALRSVLRAKPRINVHHHIGEFFSRPRSDLESAVKKYLKEREPYVSEGDSAVRLHEESAESVVDEEKDVPREILDTVLQKAFERLGLNLNDDDWDLQEIVNKITPSESIVKKIISELMDNTVAEGDREILQYLSTLHDDDNDELVNNSPVLPIPTEEEEEVEEEGNFI
ncbi:hypothetical protein RN001_014180 [Aquatica leii]|uniref:Uncharacterized protein n=1 Tax=Aquatica leii TaxID=1421715 RepID=A0AAN7Q0I8_9COLE|nr:hypothetical protein RN001_014180 [Aquatica leii]